MEDDGLGIRLARLREERDMTQQALADASGINRAQIQAMESGRTGNPGVYTLIPLARAMNVSVDELVGLTGAPPGPDLIDAFKLLIDRAEALGRRPYDDFTPQEFGRWSLGSSLTYAECLAAIGHVNKVAMQPPLDASATASAAYFVTGAVAGAMLERWRK